jgi:N-methylhydantoinase A
LGLIQVGPDSSSAVPGPACYGQGGLDPTVTDADLVLGYLDAGSFLGGDMQLDLAAAGHAIEKQIAQPLSLSVVDAAFGIHETVNEAMAQAASIHALEKGLKASHYAMVPIGGAGPVHACHVAMKLDMRHVLIPRGAGVASAFGFLASPMSFQFVKAQISSLTQLDTAAVQGLVADLQQKGLAMMSHSGLTLDQCRVKVSAAMRYVGQGYEVEVPVDMVSPMADLVARMAHGFSTCYQQLYGRTEKDTPAEVVSWRVVVQGPAPDLLQVADSLDEAALPQADAALKGHRPVFCVQRKSFVTTPVYARHLLAVGAVLEGPAIIEERESTVVVPHLARVTVDAHWNLRIDLPLQSS